VYTHYAHPAQEHPMTTTRQEVDLKVIVTDNDLIIIETGAGSITINYEESECLRTLLANAWYELVERRREGRADQVPFPVKEIELS
jgi:hypothetical protein